MAQFIPGQLYKTDPSYQYGTRKGMVTSNTMSPNIPSVTWACQKNSKTFSVWLDENNVVQRRRNRSDDLGRYVFTNGKFPGAPVLRAEFPLGPDKAWGTPKS